MPGYRQKTRSWEQSPTASTRVVSLTRSATMERLSREAGPDSVHSSLSQSPRTSTMTQQRELRRLLEGTAQRQESPSATGLLMLQRTLGNRATNRLLKKRSADLGPQIIPAKAAPATNVTADHVIAIETAPVIRLQGDTKVVQREFAVEVSVGRSGMGNDRKVTAVRFGERPPTQFGSKQEDHVIAWTIKTQEVRDQLMKADNLKDAAALLVMTIDDTNALLEDNKIEEVAANYSRTIQEAKDDLDLQQAIQLGARQYLEAYNANESITRKRQGAGDPKEGARVKTAKNKIVEKFGKVEKATDETVHDFVKALGETFQLALTQEEIKEDAKSGYPQLTMALGTALLSGFNLVASGQLIKRTHLITKAFLKQEAGDKLRLGPDDGELIYSNLAKAPRFHAFLD
jgi:hypothetical protein